ncbi:MAG: hypothetical protein AAFO72_10880 [Pseudomonadota bacterium]
MFTSIFKTTTLSTLIAAIAATMVLTHPTIAGEGGNMDRMKIYLTDEDAEELEEMSIDQQWKDVERKWFETPADKSRKFTETLRATSDWNVEEDGGYSIGARFNTGPSVNIKYDR